MNRYLAGAIGGLLATIPMTIAMEALFRRLPREEQYPLPPREITQDLMLKAGQDHYLNEELRTELSLLSHFAYGAFAGSLYPLALKRVSSPLLLGSGYGVAIWAGSYFGWIPALKILAPPNRHPARRRKLMIGVHLIWGAGTVWIGERLATPEAAAGDLLSSGR